MTLYNIELLFSEDMPKDVQETIKKLVKTSVLSTHIRLHEAKLRYIPVIEVSAIKGSCSNRKILKYLESRVEVRRGRSRFEIFEMPIGKPQPSRYYHYFWPPSVFELDEVKAELELMKSDSFLRLENEEDVKLVKEVDLWYDAELDARDVPEYGYKDKWDRMSEEEKNKAIWEVVLDFVRHNALAYEKILNTYKKFGKLFWFTFYYSD
ncbi:MAG: hypothetical protein FGF48_11320 [Candidatus Brockarchaeota archaeon]|nr:hypothetical protein [Candidatus Brockarchaeota archaeon]